MKRAFEAVTACGGGSDNVGRGAIPRFCGRCHVERNRQGLENEIIEPDFRLEEKGEMQCRQRLGGLLRYYHRDAA